MALLINSAIPGRCPAAMAEAMAMATRLVGSPGGLGRLALAPGGLRQFSRFRGWVASARRGRARGA